MVNLGQAPRISFSMNIHSYINKNNTFSLYYTPYEVYDNKCVNFVVLSEKI